MITTLHILSSGPNKLNDWADRHPKPEHTLIAVLKDEKEANAKVQKKKRQVQIHVEKFREWRMPEQSAGYIKAKKHGML